MEEKERKQEKTKCKSCGRVTMVINCVEPNPDWVNERLKEDLEFYRAENRRLQDKYHRLWKVGMDISALYIDTLLSQRDKSGTLIRPKLNLLDPDFQDIVGDIIDSQRINGQPIDVPQAYETAVKILGEGE